MAQSSVSDTEGAFFSSRALISFTVRTTWSASDSSMSGTLVRTICSFALDRGVVEVQEQAAPFERFR